MLSYDQLLIVFRRLITQHTIPVLDDRYKSISTVIKMSGPVRPSKRKRKECCGGPKDLSGVNPELF